jgi:rhodanese-related sulfurtransferase
MTEFTLNTTMKEVENRFPFSRALLHAKFHLGGCASCGFEPHESIEEVAQKHSKNAEEIVEALNEGWENTLSAEITVSDLHSLMSSGKNPLLIDVRESWEFDIVRLPSSLRLDESNMDRLFQQARENPLVVLVCHHGVRSLNAALFFRQNGVPQALSLKGGIDAYSQKIDTSLPRY